MNTTISALRDVCAIIPTVESCKIGLEKNITPDSYPLIRIVPQRVSAGQPYQRRTVESFIYFGVKKDEGENGLEAVYTAMWELEALIVEAIKAQGHRYVETLFDEDDVAGRYKVAAIRCDITGEN